MYQALRPSRALVGGLAHGWMDVAASWQFVVDAMEEERFIIAPDWRGFGLTDGGGVDNYWMADYLADLEWLLDHYAGEGDDARQVDLVGHSMGGNVAMHYAGVRPQRIRRLVNLEGFGMPARKPGEAPSRYGQWIDELKRLHRGEMALAGYSAVDGVARRLMKTNPRLTPDKAAWLASHWSVSHAQPDGSERWQILGDAAHKIVNAHIFRVDETLALYSRITAPLLMVEASDDSLHGWWKNRYNLISRGHENGLDETMHRLGVSLLAYSPLAFGLLTGKYDQSGIEGPDAPKDARISSYESVRKQRWGRPDSLRAAKRYNQLARDNGLTPTQLALAFCYTKWQVASTIIGVTSLAQLEEDLDVYGTTLSPEILAEIDKIRWDIRDPAA